MNATKNITENLSAVNDALERVRELEQLMVHAQSELQKAIVNLTLPGECATVEGIIARVSRYYHVERSEMLSRARGIEGVAWARMVAISLCYEFCRISTTRLGAFFRRDHGTVLHAVQRVKGRTEVTPTLRYEVEQLRHMVQDDASNSQGARSEAPVPPQVSPEIQNHVLLPGNKIARNGQSVATRAL